MIDSFVIKIKSPKMPPDIDFIEAELKRLGYSAVRWAIVDVENTELSVALSCIVK